MLNLRRLLRNYRHDSRGFAELVPWMILLTPALVLNKDGSLLAVFEMRGVDAEGVPVVEVDHQVRALEHALRSFDERFALWWTVDRRRVAAPIAARFADPVSEHLDQLWCQAFADAAQFANRHTVAVTFAPTGETTGRWTLSRRASFALDAARLDLACTRFEDALRAFTETLPDLGLSRLVDEGLLGLLHDRVAPAGEGQRVCLPDPPCYLDTWLPDNALSVTDDRLRFGHLDQVEIGALAIKGWPGSTWPGALDSLLSTPGELSIVLAFRFEHAERAARRIRDAERHHRNLQKTFTAYLKEAITREESAMVNEGRLRLAADAAEALAYLTAEGGAFGHCALIVLTRGTVATELDVTTREAASRLRRVGYLVLRERLNLLGAFSVSIPGQWAMSPRWHLVANANLADLAPIRSHDAGSARNAHLSQQLGSVQPALARLPTDAQTPLFFDLHVGDVGHAIVLGPSGSGKSVLMNFLLGQSRKYPGSRVIIFDKNYSCRIATLLQGGAHVDVGSEHGEVRLNPLALLRDKGQWEWLAGWLELLLTARGHEMSSDDDRALRIALGLLGAQPPGTWQLCSLVPLLPGQLAEALLPWVGDALLARYFDHSTDTFSLSDFCCIEIGELFRDARLACAFLEYAFHRLELELDGRPAVIYVEEAWFMLGEPRFCARLNDWLRTMRKKNAAVVLATQSLDEIDRSAIFASVVDNIPTRIYLANPHAGAHRRLYLERFALNDVQLARIRDATPKRDYYITQPGRSRMVNCMFPTRLLAALRSDPNAQRIFARHYAARAPGWAFDYLDEAAGPCAP